jgi:hypothetical protein
LDLNDVEDLKREGAARGEGSAGYEDVTENTHWSSTQSCRCLPTNATCWSAIPWSLLNSSIGGRLVTAIDPLSPCSLNTSSPECDNVLVDSDNEVWVSDQPAGYLHTGLFNSWNVSTRLPSFAVLAQSANDISAAVAFASKYNIRIFSFF